MNNPLFVILAFSFVSMASIACQSGGQKSIVGFWNLEGEDPSMALEFREDGTINIPGEPAEHIVARCREAGAGDVAEMCQSRWKKTDDGIVIEDAHLADGHDGGCECQYKEFSIEFDGADTFTFKENDASMTVRRVDAP